MNGEFFIHVLLRAQVALFFRPFLLFLANLFAVEHRTRRSWLDTIDNKFVTRAIRRQMAAAAFNFRQHCRTKISRSAQFSSITRRTSCSRIESQLKSLFYSFLLPFVRDLFVATADSVKGSIKKWKWKSRSLSIQHVAFDFRCTNAWRFQNLWRHWHLQRDRCRLWR